jgi:hypothetical protein
VEAAVSQYCAYLDGRIEEVALDYYAQADDGSVWYLGEDVSDYDRNGLIDSFLGSWLAGREGPPEMIMPADPQVGDVHRAENIPAIAFEEVAIKDVDRTVNGPPGKVEGAMVARELHDDGTYSDKIFAPGYGEFYTAHGGEVEALALAVPTDALDEPVPPQLGDISASALDAVDAIAAAQWGRATAARDAAAQSWDAYRSENQTPPRLAREMSRALSGLGAGIRAADAEQAGNAAIDVTLSSLDFQLRYRPQPEIDFDRFGVWARQIRDRFAHVLEPADLTAIDAALVTMREGLMDGEPGVTIHEAARLADDLERIQPTDSA